jgi:HEAT repeat protein
MSEHAAPAIATMLAEGHKNRKEPKGWIQVYRPLYILKGMGEHAKVALPDVIKALDDPYGPVAGAAADVLGNMGPTAKGAGPDLLRVWEKSRKIPGRPGATKALAAALKKIDPEAAEKAGIK